LLYVDPTVSACRNVQKSVDEFRTLLAIDPGVERGVVTKDPVVQTPSVTGV
jgi:hypothetical protein